MRTEYKQNTADRKVTTGVRTKQIHSFSVIIRTSNFDLSLAVLN